MKIPNLKEAFTLRKKDLSKTEELKAKDQMAWVYAMEQIKHTAEESVLENIAYAGGISK